MIYVIYAAIIVSITTLICVWWFRRCKHDWIVLKVIKVYDTDISRDIPTGTKFVMQCKKCGAIKKTEV